MPTPTLEELLEEVQSLKKALLDIEEKEKLRLKNQYDKSYSKLRNAILKTSEIENVIENTHEKLGIADLLNDLIQINNPYSDKLGFRFADVIQEKVKKILLSHLPDDKNENGKKNRFLRIIKKVIDNPVADIILKSNPIGAVVGNVINTATNLIDTTWSKVEETKIGKGLKEIALTTKDEITNEKLRQFQQSVEKYSELYSKMLSITLRFDTRIDILKNSFNGIFLSYKDINLKFINSMKLDPLDPFGSLDDLFKKNDSNNNGFLFQDILSKPEVISGLEFLNGISDIEVEATKYSDEFASTLKLFVESYIEVLKIPIINNWNPDEIDIQKLKIVINKLHKFLSSNISVTSIPETLSGTRTLALISFNDELSRFVV